MGKVMSVIVRQANKFNVENRAHRIISQDKPVAAPKYESNIKDLERVINEIPDIADQLSKKDNVLDERLKNVFVTSSDIENPVIEKNKSKLPQNRKAVEDFEYGFLEPDALKLARGKCTLRQAIQFISDHQTNPADWSANKIANQYKMKEDLVGNILKHFRTFQIHIPEKEKSQKLLIDQKSLLLESNEKQKQQKN